MDSKLINEIHNLAEVLGVEDNSFLRNIRATSDKSTLREQVIDGLTLALISFCYHEHPRSKNVYEIMDQLDSLDPNSQEAQNLQLQAEEAANLQIPFIVNLNCIIENYYQIRHKLEILAD